MVTTQLIDRIELQKYKQISNSINEAKLNELILQSQLVDLLPLLGERLYYDILNNVGSYTDLLNGSSYNYNGVTYENVGLKCVLSHYVYARHVMYGDQVDTAFGIREKLNNDVSKQVDYSMKKTTFKNNNEVAYNLWLNVERFLVRTNVELYKFCKTPKQKYFKISKIG